MQQSNCKNAHHLLFLKTNQQQLICLRCVVNFYIFGFDSVLVDLVDRQFEIRIFCVCCFRMMMILMITVYLRWTLYVDRVSCLVSCFVYKRLFGNQVTSRQNLQFTRCVYFLAVFFSLSRLYGIAKYTCTYVYLYIIIINMAVGRSVCWMCQASRIRIHAHTHTH